MRTSGVLWTARPYHCLSTWDRCKNDLGTSDPKYKGALSNKGDALNGLGKYKEDVTYFDKALSIDPNYKDALSGKGQALYKLGNYSGAIIYLDRALAIPPTCQGEL
ncbi:MAG: tetratricopeptide repeat protein [Candidatus Nitrosopolaris sp.]